MTEMTDEELIAFLKANKDRVKGFIISELPDLMESAKKETESGFDDVRRRPRPSWARSRISSKRRRKPTRMMTSD